MIDAAGERSEQGRFLSKSPGSSNAVLGGAAFRTRFDHSAQRTVDRIRGWKLGSHVGSQKDEVRTLGKSRSILSTNAVREVVFRPHVFTDAGSSLRLSLLHKCGAQSGWRVER